MDNIIEDWLEQDKELLSIILSIDSRTRDEYDAALLAFKEVAEYLVIPKQPEDFTEKMYEEHEKLGFDAPRSVLEELALVNYLFPDEDIRGNVMVALYNVQHKNYLDYEDAAVVYFDGYENIPEQYMIYFFGDAIDAKLSFDLPEGKTWVEAGAKLAAKVLSPDNQ